MGLLERIRGLLGRESEDAAYRCIQCGEGYDRDRRECEVCGSPFVAAADGAEESANDPGGLP